MRYSFWRRGREARYALALVVLAAGVGTAEAQQKRLGFVVGMSEYGATAHPTALQDAGLVAQSLKGAGFEVQEAANLRQGRVPRRLPRIHPEGVGSRAGCRSCGLYRGCFVAGWR